MKRLIEIINTIKGENTFINDIIEFDTRYDLARFDGELLVIEKEEKSQSTRSFFYLNADGKVTHEHAEGDADRFVSYYNTKEQLKIKWQHDLDLWSQKWKKG